MRGQKSGSFRTCKGVRQGCALSPLLFNLYMAGIDERLKVRKIGGIEIDRERIWNFAYTDDIVLLAKNKEALEDMINTFRKFLSDRKLELNVKKLKILVFNRGNNEKKERWRWKDETIEKVQSFKYLGFIFSRRGNYKEHIKELANKGRIAVRKVWGLEERMCRNDLIRRWNFLQSMIRYRYNKME